MEAKDLINKIKEVLNLKTEVVDLATIARVEKWYITVNENEFKKGSKITKTYYDGNTEPLSAGEYDYEGTKIMVDSSGIITSTDKPNINLKKEDLKMEEVDLKPIEDKLEALTTLITAIEERLKNLEAEEPAKVEADEADEADKTDVKAMSEKIKLLTEKLELLAKAPIPQPTVSEQKLSFAEKQIAMDIKNQKNK